MNLYAVFVDGAEIHQFIAESVKKAYYKVRDDLKIEFRQGVKILEIVPNWCEPDWERRRMK